jgi:hypothetical protein
LSADAVFVTSGLNGPADAGAIMTCPKSGCTAPLTLVGSLHHPVAIATDEAAVYWADEGTHPGTSIDGDVGKCALSGCPAGPTFLATSQNEPGAIALDATCVYWALSPSGVGTGDIQRTAK